MAKGNQWGYVFPQDRDKLTKYFNRRITSDVYIRIYQVYKCGSFVQYLQVSGNDEGFSSCRINDDETERQIYRDFPWIKEKTLYKV